MKRHEIEQELSKVLHDVNVLTERSHTELNTSIFLNKQVDVLINEVERSDITDQERDTILEKMKALARRIEIETDIWKSGMNDIEKLSNRAYELAKMIPED